MKDQLTVLELKNYLGTGLKMVFEKSVRVIELSGLQQTDAKNLIFIGSDGVFYEETIWSFKPKMFRLQDLDKHIPELGFVPIQIIGDEIYSRQPLGFKYPQDAILWFDAMYLMEGNTDEMPFWVFQKLFQWHFWVFDQSFFEKGLIIDKLKVV